MARGLITFRGLAFAAFMLAACVSQARAQTPQQCMQLTKLSYLSAIWTDLINYILPSDPAPQALKSREQLEQLRVQIVDLESLKTQLIKIVQAHIDGNRSGSGVAADLRFDRIPGLLAQIDMVSQGLAAISHDGDMFAAEEQFKKLKSNIDLKRNYTLCRLQNEMDASAADVAVMQDVVNELQGELQAISKAEEALGKYIKEKT